MTSQPSYSNPFSAYNANVMDSKTILAYWCSPFSHTQAKQTTEEEIFSEGMPLVFMGGRGTGKTMFLKYCSFGVQKEEALSQQGSSSTSEAILAHTKSRGAIGFYVRIDGPVLRSFSGGSYSAAQWDAVFSHYFETKVCQAYIEVMRDLMDAEVIQQEIFDRFVPEVGRLLSPGSDSPPKTLDDILDILKGNLEEISDFRGRMALSDTEFVPQRGRVFTSMDLSFAVPEIAGRTIESLPSDLKYLICIDEYENFGVRQQQVVNTLLKFVNQNVTFRLGMRLEGFHTFDTVNANEFIKEDRDYHKIVFEDLLQKTSGYKEFLKLVAKKRLESVPLLNSKGILDIESLLGAKEHLEEEALDLVRSRANHQQHFSFLKNGEDAASGLIANPDAPLMEMLNILWVNRGVSPEETKEAMTDHLAGRKTQLSKKYKQDFVDKYKLSLMFLLASAYRTNKKYYSFNTFCFLSSGIVGHFIELCRRTFQNAYFSSRSELLEHGTIPAELQNQAARDLARSELQMVTRIYEHGAWLHNFAMNLGNLFGSYHRDRNITYPETNQFATDIESIDVPNVKEAFKSALEWSVVQRKPDIQGVSPGARKAELHTLNRVFSPQFQITYRTRGGYSVDLSTTDLTRFMSSLLEPRQMPKPISKQEEKPAQKTFEFGAGE